MDKIEKGDIDPTNEFNGIKVGDIAKKPEYISNLHLDTDKNK